MEEALAVVDSGANAAVEEGAIALKVGGANALIESGANSVVEVGALAMVVGVAWMRGASGWKATAGED